MPRVPRFHRPFGTSVDGTDARNSPALGTPQGGGPHRDLSDACCRRSVDTERAAQTLQVYDECQEGTTAATGCRPLLALTPFFSAQVHQSAMKVSGTRAPRFRTPSRALATGAMLSR